MTYSVAGLAQLLDKAAAQALAREAVKAAKARADGSPRPGRVMPSSVSLRAVLLVPDSRFRAARIDLMGRYASERGYCVASIAGTVADALAAICAGEADRLLVVDGWDLLPAVEIVTETPRPPSQGQRRPRRLG